MVVTNLSLCSGFGGLDLAVEWITGNTTEVYAENDPHAAAVMAAHWPHAENLGDITAADWADVARRYSIHSLTAGFPCQGISNAGLRKGLADARTAIWKNVAEAVRITRPRLVFLENVDAIRTRDKGQVLGQVLADLAAIGYDARWTCLPARDVRAPHLRWRWLCIAHPAAEDPDSAAWRERWAAAPGQASRGGHGPTLDDEVTFLLPHPDGFGWDGGAGDLPEAEGRGEPADSGDEAAVTLLPTPAARDWKSGASNLIGTNSRPLNEVAVNVRLDERWIASDGTDYGPAIRRWEAITGRPAPSPTERGRAGNRRLSPRFTEWLMGLPDGWVTGLGLQRPDQLKILGNGVVTQQAIEGYRRLLCADLEAMNP